jgi:hypothetical protein
MSLCLTKHHTTKEQWGIGIASSILNHRGGTGSIPGQSVWDLWWTEWHWDRFFPRVLRFSPVNFIPPVFHYLET